MECETKSCVHKMSNACELVPPLVTPLRVTCRLVMVAMVVFIGGCAFYEIEQVRIHRRCMLSFGRLGSGMRSSVPCY